MRENDFRRIALAMEGAAEGAHMGHPDFRVNNRIFATLHHDRTFGMVALTADQQEQFMRAHPDAFAPESGAWVAADRRGSGSLPSMKKRWEKRSRSHGRTP